MRPLKALVLTLTVIALMVAPQLALAVITFDQLDDDTFIVSHKIKLYGSRGKAMKLVYEKAASLCVAAGYTYLAILDQESDAGGGQNDSANASARVRFHFEDGEGRIDCTVKASEKYISQAAVKLDKRGYKQPDLVASTTTETSTDTGSCTIEQIATMVQAGLAREQIEAACETD